MSDQKQPLPWPDAVEYADWLGDGYANYQRARAEAAMSRLRIAVEALMVAVEDDIFYCAIVGLDPTPSYRRLTDAIAAIGPLPPETGA